MSSSTRRPEERRSSATTPPQEWIVLGLGLAGLRTRAGCGFRRTVRFQRPLRSRLEIPAAVAFKSEGKSDGDPDAQLPSFFWLFSTYCRASIQTRGETGTPCRRAASRAVSTGAVQKMNSDFRSLPRETGHEPGQSRPSSGLICASSSQPTIASIRPRSSWGSTAQNTLAWRLRQCVQSILSGSSVRR